MKTVELTLRLTYDDTVQTHPRRWDWFNMLRLEKPESVQILAEGEADEQDVP